MVGESGYDAGMQNDNGSKMGMGRTLAVAGVMWGLFAGAMGVAAWRVQANVTPAAVTLKIDDARVNLPASLVVGELRHHDGIFTTLCLAESADPKGRALLGSLVIDKPLPLLQALLEISRELTQLKPYRPGGTGDHILYQAHNFNPQNAGPLNGYLVQLVKRVGKQVLSHYVIGATTPDQKHYLVLAMRFDLPDELLKSDRLNKVLEHNLGVYHNVAQTIVIES